MKARMSLPGLLFLGLLFLLPFHARAGQILLAENQSIRIRLAGIEIGAETIGLNLICINQDQSGQLILFLLPQVNGEDTVFISQWPGEEVFLPSNQETAVHLQIKNAYSENVNSIVAFRIAWMGNLSVPLEIDLKKPENFEPLSFAEKEMSAVKTDVISWMDVPPEPIVINDQITAEEKEKLDYAQAWICIKRKSKMIPFCRIPLEINDSGEATAMYSGIAFVPEIDPMFPFPVSQEDFGKETAFRTESIGLSGPSVFYASMHLTLSKTSKDSWAVSEQVFSSDELGGSYPLVPLALADRAESVLRILEDSETPGETVSVHSSELPLEQPLSLAVCDVRSLGEIRIYCEYFFNDATDQIHLLPHSENRKN